MQSGRTASFISRSAQARDRGLEGGECRLGAAVLAQQAGVEAPEILEQRRVGSAVAPAEVHEPAEVKPAAPLDERRDGVPDLPGLPRRAGAERARGTDVRPAELRDPDLRGPVVSAIEDRAEALDLPEQLAGGLAVRVHGERVEAPARARSEQRLHESE